MLRIIFLAAFAFSSVSAIGELVILHSPESLKFNENVKEKLDQSLLTEVFSAALGFTPGIELYTRWPAISFNDPRELPKAIVNIVIDRVEFVDLKGGKHFPLNADENEEKTWRALSSRMDERSQGDHFRIYLGDESKVLDLPVFGPIKPVTIKQESLKFLNISSVDVDGKFIKEIELLRAIAETNIKNIQKPNGKPNVFWFVFTSLHSVYETHVNNSDTTMEAVELLNEALNQLAESFKKYYNDKVLITVFPNNAIPDPEKFAGKTSDLDHAAVHIIIWFSASFCLTMLAIILSMVNMDPGKDSIIYRMTLTKIKKEN